MHPSLLEHPAPGVPKNVEIPRGSFPPEGRQVPSLPFSWAALRALLRVPTVTSHEASSGG